jgi:hypothetical protein
MPQKISPAINSEAAKKPGPTHPPTEEELNRAVAELQAAGIFGPNAPTRGPLWIGDY